MKTASLLLVLLPSFAGAAFTGTVSLLDGTPLSGAVVRLGTDSVATPVSGAFEVARSAGLHRRPTAAREVSRNLQVRGGRLILSWNGIDPAGRHVAMPAIPSIAAARSLGASDTLMVFWKGKRLVALPLPSDTGSLSFRVDTAWSDDAGIPWNAHIPYGTLRDVRDGRTYRTVQIGAQTWMAENLDWRGNADTVGTPGASGMGRYYKIPEWNDGLCPGAGWRVARSADWDSLILAVSRQLLYIDPGTGLKAVRGWDSAGSGTDRVGFRGLSAGISLNGSPIQVGQVGIWGLARDSAHIPMLGRLLHDLAAISKIDTFTSSMGASLRCIRD